MACGIGCWGGWGDESGVTDFITDIRLLIKAFARFLGIPLKKLNFLRHQKSQTFHISLAYSKTPPPKKTWKLMRYICMSWRGNHNLNLLT